MDQIIVHTYKYSDIIDKNTLLGSKIEMWDSIADQCDAIQLLIDLEIEFKKTDSKFDFPAVIFKMNDAQHILWRVAGGDQWFRPSGIDEYDFEHHFNNELPGWEKYIDTYVNYRKDHHIISADLGWVRYVDTNNLASKVIRFQKTKIDTLNCVLPKELHLA